MKILHKILKNADAISYENEFFMRSRKSQYEIIKQVGANIAKNFYLEFSRFLKKNSTVLAMLGSGHNAADALAMLVELKNIYPHFKTTIILPQREKLRENTVNFLDEFLTYDNIEIFHNITDIKINKFNLVIEGLTGMSYAPPMRPNMAEKIEFINSLKADVKFSIDVPAGISDARETSQVFNADVTYATAIAKECLFATKYKQNVGKIRYIDVGFFDDDKQNLSSKYVINPRALDILKQLRPTLTDKRSYGRLLIISGSQKYAGASLLNAKTAIRAGVGFVYSCVIEDFKPAFVASEPSVIWHACTPDENGGIALENFSEINALAKCANAILIGSGLTNSRECIALVKEILKNNSNVPTVLDADAICKEVLENITQHTAPVILTPHEGEFLRIAQDTSDDTLIDTAKKYSCTIVLKSNITRISDGNSIVFSTRGCPALARAGSGDILCALIGAILANKHLLSSIKDDDNSNQKLSQKVASIATQWLGEASEIVANEFSETSLASSDIINFLHKPLS